MNLLMKIDTRLLDQFSSILTVGILLCMVIAVARFLFSKNTLGAIASIGICGILLWAVSSPNSFMTFINMVITFVSSIFAEN